MFVGQLHHAVREGGREEHIETLFRARHAPEKKADIFNKAKVKHSIGLIENQHLGRIEIKDMFFKVVDYPAWSANEYIYPLFNGLFLLLITGSTIGESQFESGKLANLQEIFVNLDCKLTSWGKYQSPRLIFLA